MHIQVVTQCPPLTDMPACSLGLTATKDGLPVCDCSVRNSMTAPAYDGALYRKALRALDQRVPDRRYFALRRVSGMISQIMAKPVAATAASPMNATLLPK